MNSSLLLSMTGPLLAFWDYVIVFLMVLTVVVFVHELGHFLVARWAGVKVDVFSIGFGPELFGWTARSGTRWRFSLIPVGGYVKMFGDADPSSTPDLERDFTPEEKAVAFHFKTLAQRAAIVVAGPAANFLFGIIVLSFLFMANGEQFEAPVIGDVEFDSAAAEAGLLPGDRIVEANGNAIKQFQDIKRIVVMTADGGDVALTVLRDGTTLKFSILPRIKDQPDIFGNIHKTPILGIRASPQMTESVSLGPLEAIRESVAETGQIIEMNLVSVGQILTGRRSTDELGGPVQIAKYVGQAAKLGVATVIYLSVQISISLGLFNLFPIPILDGGRLLFYGIEVIKGKPLGIKAQEYGFRFGLFLVFALMLFVTGKDLQVWEHLKAMIS